VIDFLRRWFSRPVLVTEGDKLGRHFKVIKSLYCRCVGCQNYAYCHGLCRDHRDDKRKRGYRC
jgi:hypothetical protein